jgi:hypothetical protein
MTGHERRPRGRRRGFVAAAAALGALASGGATACDVCAIYTATELRENRPGLEVGVGEQFTYFGTLQRDGEEVPNPGERVRSSITQLLVAYNVTPRVGFQLNLPIISRTFRRLEEGRLRSGDETGVGDLSLLANVLAFSRVGEDSVFRFSLLGGLKLPSGDSSRLREELAPHHGAAEGGAAHVATAFPQHVTGGGDDAAGGHVEESGVHGHDLALGSGSVDGVVGGQLFWSWRRLYATVGGQYAVRTEGDFGYRYANDLTWAGGPGIFLLTRHDATLGVQAAVAGETKSKDTLDGATLDDTGITSLFAGPAFGFTWRSSLGADLRAEIPVLLDNTALQIVPDYRLRGGFTWRF